MKKILLTFILFTLAQAETVYVTRVASDMYITDDKEIIETSACLAFALMSDKAIIDGDRIIFTEDDEVCDIYRRSSEQHVQAVPPQKREYVNKKIGDAIEREVVRLTKEYPNFDIVKISDKLNEIYKKDKEKANRLNTPIGWELLYLKYFNKKQ